MTDDDIKTIINCIILNTDLSTSVLRELMVALMHFKELEIRLKEGKI